MSQRDTLSTQRYNNGTQSFLTTAVSQASNAFAAETKLLRIAATADTRFLVAKTPVATILDALLPAGAVDYIACKGGDKIASIQVSIGGQFTVTEMTA